MKELKIFDNPGNVVLVRKVLFAVCALLIAVNFFVPMHGEFFWERYVGFFAAFGFVACVGLVVAARRILRPLVRRDEDYYD